MLGPLYYTHEQLWFTIQAEFCFPKTSENGDRNPTFLLVSCELPVLHLHVKWGHGPGIAAPSHPTLFDSAACMRCSLREQARQLLPVSISVIVFRLVGCGGLCPVRDDDMEPGGVCGSSSQNPARARLGNPAP